MNFIKEIKGLKFPDLYIVKFFFKELGEGGGNVLELGCGNGNNLSLFYSYGYDVCGVDISKKSIENALYNFKHIFKNNNKNSFEFFCEDMRNIDNILHKKTDILLIPNVINYLPKKDFLEILPKIKKILNKKAKFFIRFRSPRDMRVGLGKKVNENEYIVESDITGEKNSYLSVYEESEMLQLLQMFFKVNNFKIFHIYEENYHTDRKILNADIVIWGEISL